MLQSRQQKPISPQQMFQRLLNQTYREAQCQDQSQKLKKQKVILIQLIQEYDRSIQQQLVKNTQCDQLERVKLQKLEDLERLKRQRDLISQSVNEQMARITVTEGELEEKAGLITQLEEIRTVNGKMRLKVRDLMAYVERLELHNQTLLNETAQLQNRVANRLRVNSQDWRQRIELIQKQQETSQNEFRAKMIEKEIEQVQNIRRQEDEIKRRNEARWQEFRKAAFKPSLHPQSLNQNQNIQPFITRRLPSHNFERFRVI